jgi:hypothetical protein
LVCLNRKKVVGLFKREPRHCVILLSSDNTHTHTKGGIRCLGYLKGSAKKGGKKGPPPRCQHETTEPLGALLLPSSLCLSLWLLTNKKGGCVEARGGPNREKHEGVVCCPWVVEKEETRDGKRVSCGR